MLKQEKNNLTKEHSKAFKTLLFMDQVKGMLELDIPALGALIKRRDCMGMALAFGGLRRLHMNLPGLEAAISAGDQETIEIAVTNFVHEAGMVVTALNMVHERLGHSLGR